MFTGTWEWVIVFAVLLLLFGGSKLPKLGGALGESIRNFRKGIDDNLTEKSKPSLSKDSSDNPPPSTTSSS